jgi:hypothetical protein
VSYSLSFGMTLRVKRAHSLPGLLSSFQYNFGCVARISMPLRMINVTNNRLSQWSTRSHTG